MAPIYEDNCLAIGNTPLVKLHSVTNGCKATVLAKIEGRNPAYSVKCRIGANMIWDAEQKGLLTKEKTIVEFASNSSHASPPRAANTPPSMVEFDAASSKIVDSKIKLIFESPAPFTSAIPGIDNIESVTFSIFSFSTAATTSRSPIDSFLLLAEPASCAL